MNQWYIQKDNQILGPFTHEQMIQKKQNAELFDHDYVWSEYLAGWTRAFYVKELKISSDYNGLNRRKHPRFKAAAECLITNKNYTYLGRVISLSNGGALVEAQNPFLQIGESIILMVKPGPDLKEGFVSRGIIRNKEFIPFKVQFKSRCQYVVTFDAELSLIQKLAEHVLTREAG